MQVPAPPLTKPLTTRPQPIDCAQQKSSLLVSAVGGLLRTRPSK